MEEAGTTTTIPHLEDHTVHISLFKDVKNAGFLRDQLLQGNAEFEYGFLDAASILSVNHVLAAVFRAVNDSIHNRMKSRNVHSEVVFCLSPTNNIADSFRRFGLQSTTTDLLAIKVTPKSATSTTLDPSSHLAQSVQGTRVPFNNESLQQMTDLERIRKTYKLTDFVAGGGGMKGKKGVVVNGDGGERSSFEAQRDALERVVMSMMALRGS